MLKHRYKQYGRQYTHIYIYNYYICFGSRLRNPQNTGRSRCVLAPLGATRQSSFHSSAKLQTWIPFLGAQLVEDHHIHPSKEAKPQ